MNKSGLMVNQKPTKVKTVQIRNSFFETASKKKIGEILEIVDIDGHKILKMN